MKRIPLPDRGAESLFGIHDENLRFLEMNLGVRIKNQGADLVVEGPGRASTSRAKSSSS